MSFGLKNYSSVVSDSVVAPIKPYFKFLSGITRLPSMKQCLSNLYCSVACLRVQCWVLFCEEQIQSLSLLLAASGVKYYFYADECLIYGSVTIIDETKTKLTTLLSDIKI